MSYRYYRYKYISITYNYIKVWHPSRKQICDWREGVSSIRLVGFAHLSTFFPSALVSAYPQFVLLLLNLLSQYLCLLVWSFYGSYKWHIWRFIHWGNCILSSSTLISSKPFSSVTYVNLTKISSLTKTASMFIVWFIYYLLNTYLRFLILHYAGLYDSLVCIKCRSCFLCRSELGWSLFVF